MGSKHAFQQEARATKNTEAAVAKFAGIETGELPVSRTIDDVLKRLNHEELNDVLVAMLKELRKNKFFARYRKLTPAGGYHIAIDAVHSHTYQVDSAHDCENCPFCLKRQRGNAIWYIHYYSVAVLVCPGGIRLPLYIYPIHAKALKSDGANSQEDFKQECESAALSIILEQLRERFPKLHFCVLLDSLYANGPTIKLLQKYRMEFLIVRKNGSMKTVGEDCDGLLKLDQSKGIGRVEECVQDGKNKIERVFQFCNDVDYQDLQISILRFDERIFNEAGVEIFCTHWEWISSAKITKKNASSTAMRGRMRWLEEDLFNTLKNRGFQFKHDYSRNSSAQLVWTFLIMLAFFITELFTLTQKVVHVKGKRSLRDFMKAIFYEIKHIGCLIFQSSLLDQKTQIRYCFKKL